MSKFFTGGRRVGEILGKGVRVYLLGEPCDLSLQVVKAHGKRARLEW